MREMSRNKYNPQRVDTARRMVIDTVPLTLVLSRYGLDSYNDKIVCPFHNDDNPSCFVSDELKTYHCFGCHAKGTVVEFVRDYERIYGEANYSQVRAIKDLAREYGVDIPDLEDKSLIQPEKKERKKRQVDTKRLIEKKLDQIEKRTRGIEDLNQRLEIYRILDEYYFGKITGEEAITQIKGDRDKW